MGLQVGFDDEVDEAGGERAIGVAVSAVAREPRLRLEAMKGLAIGRVQDMFEAGVVEPMRVTSTALATAASVATLILTTETLVGDFTAAPDPTAGPSRGGGAEALPPSR